MPLLHKVLQVAWVRHVIFVYKTSLIQTFMILTQTEYKRYKDSIKDYWMRQVEYFLCIYYKLILCRYFAITREMQQNQNTQN